MDDTAQPATPTLPFREEDLTGFKWRATSGYEM
jgi:hypothetical protein